MSDDRKFWCTCLIVLPILTFTKACPTKEGCEINPELGTYQCRGDIVSTTYSSKVTTLEVCDVDWDTLDLNEVIKEYPNVNNISVFNGNVSNVTVQPGQSNNIKVLRLRHLQIKTLDTKLLLYSLKKLEVLDLTGNRLQTLIFSPKLTRLQKLHISENPWNCSLSLDWILNLSHKLVNGLDNLTCSGSPYPGKPILPIAQFLYNVKTKCPEACNCSMPNVVRDPESKTLEPIIEVDCSDRSFDTFPNRLPLHTKIVHLENNNIDQLDALVHNPYYRGVLDLFLDNNRVASIEGLEGSYWLSHFRVFSLNGNKLTQIPTYALDNALQRNPNMPNAVRIYFGGNPWRCDCVFTPRFQEMLQKYQPQIQDVNDLKCSYVEGDDNSLLPILELTRSSVCHLPTEYSVRALDLLNGILASLIILVLGKLIYDYYYFKRTGRLPWIVTKMP